MANKRRPGAGPKPVPTNIKRIRGTLDPSRQVENEPEPKSDRIQKPVDLSDEASFAWDDLSPELEQLGVLTNMDIDAFRLLCETYGQWKKANKKIDEVGMLITDKKGNVRLSPYFIAADRLAKRLQVMWAEFGMTPSSRTRISAAPKEKTPNPKSPWASIGKRAG